MSFIEKVSRFAGRLLRNVRAGDGKLASANSPVERRRLEVGSPSFDDGGEIPPRHAGFEGVSPAITWADVPAEAREIVVLCEDPDAPLPKPFVHWAVYGIPATSTVLPEGMTSRPASADDGPRQGKNTLGREGFVGPKPPPGHGPHHYHFQVFALDSALPLGPGANREELVNAMRGHIVASGEVVGVYEAS